jgi:hypothetical protein
MRQNENANANANAKTVHEKGLLRCPNSVLLRERAESINRTKVKEPTKCFAELSDASFYKMRPPLAEVIADEYIRSVPVYPLKVFGPGCDLKAVIPRLARQFKSLFEPADASDL